MNERVRQLSQEILKLSADDQAELLDDLSVALHEHPDAEIERAWTVEIESRVDAVERGEMELFDADEALREARRALKR